MSQTKMIKLLVFVAVVAMASDVWTNRKIDKCITDWNSRTPTQ